MAVNIKNLKKTFGEKTAVNIEKLSIENGTMLGLVGNNGAGKTTLFRLILDLLKADTGTVSMSFSKDDGVTFETDVKVDEEWKAYTGAYIDESFLIDFLSPDEYFDFIAKVNDIKKDTLKTRLSEFEDFMTNEINGQKKLIRSLSAGNKQKTGIVSAMLNYPQLLILDEPFNFLDPSSQNHLKRILSEYNRKTQATIIISSHNLAHTIDICDRIVVMEHGNAVKDLSGNNEDTRSELEEYFGKM